MFFSKFCNEKLRILYEWVLNLGAHAILGLLMGYRTPLKLCAKLCGCFYVLLLPHRPNPQLTLNFKNSVTQKAAKNHFLQKMEIFKNVFGN
jgi:hypothetical protein